MSSKSIEIMKKIIAASLIDMQNIEDRKIVVEEIVKLDITTTDLIGWTMGVIHTMVLEVPELREYLQKKLLWLEAKG